MLIDTGAGDEEVAGREGGEEEEGSAGTGRQKEKWVHVVLQ